MDKETIITALAFAAAFAMPFQSYSAQEEEKSCQGKKIEVAAYYYSHWHVYPCGEIWKGKGWTEWEFVKTAIPRFKGHRQPIVPSLGYIAGDNPKDVEKEIEIASNAGIDVFVNCWYWYEGKRTMQEALENGFLKASNKDKMKFALMWANHDRNDQFRPAAGEKRKLLMKARHTPEDLFAAMDYCAEHYFKEKNYWKINGKNYFSVYLPTNFINDLGGAKKTRELLQKIDEKMSAKGLAKIHWNAIAQNNETAKLARLAGFESTTEYNVPPDAGARGKSSIIDYGVMVQKHKEVWNRMKEGGELVNNPVVTRGWDRTPRCRLETQWPFPDCSDYPYNSVVVNNTSDRFEKFLRDAKKFAENDSNKPFAIMLNAWNEWTEGSYLLPDKFEGNESLDAVARVFGRNPDTRLTTVDQIRGNIVEFPAPDAEMKYGEHFRQHIRFWKAKTNSRAPLLFYIHGGGWTSGCDTDIRLKSIIAEMLKNNISVASIDYMWLQDAVAAGIYPPVKAPMQDAARALQFVRSKAEKLNIDPDRICACGGSAGACTALWLAFSKDAALKDSPDKILRQSSRPNCVAVFIPQTSLDPKLNRRWIPNINYGANAFGFDNYQQWLDNREKILPLIKMYSPYELLDKNAPCILMEANGNADVGKPSKDATHSPNFVAALKEKCDKLGVDCRVSKTSDGEFLKFILEKSGR